MTNNSEALCGQSQRDCVSQPRVARHELPWVSRKMIFTSLFSVGVGSRGRRKEWFDARPHPNPLPRGEGTAVGGSAPVQSASGQYRRRFSKATANGAPSPGGEGRGEGGRFHIFPSSASIPPKTARNQIFQPQRGCDVRAPKGCNPFRVEAVGLTISQGSSCRATLGWRTESLWDTKQL